MLHPDTRLTFIDDDIGFGVVATRPIPRGTILWVLDPLDMVLPPTHQERLHELHMPVIRRYTYDRGDGTLVLCWDHARFINHACEPTCLGGGYDLEVATRDIQPGEQLTDDYGTFFVAEPMECLCGAPSCRGHVRPDDPLTYADQWDAMLAGAYPRIGELPQPLLPLVPKHILRDLADRDRVWRWRNWREQQRVASR